MNNALTGSSVVRTSQASGASGLVDVLLTLPSRHQSPLPLPPSFFPPRPHSGLRASQIPSRNPLNMAEDRDDSTRILSTVALSDAQKERLEEEAADVRQSSEYLDWWKHRLLPVSPDAIGKSLDELVTLALSEAPVKADKGLEFLRDVLQGDHGEGRFMLIDERAAASLTDDAEESCNVLAVDLEMSSIQNMFDEERYDVNKYDVKFGDKSPSDSASTRLLFKELVERWARFCIEGSYGDGWEAFVSFRWNVAPDEVLARNEGKDDEALKLVKLIRITAIRSELESAASTITVSDVKDPVDMFAYAADRARKDPRGIAAGE
ncbi:hypothetical protein V8E36_007453 [Tilletia maclaganii]